MAESQLERTSESTLVGGVSPSDVPSAAWGWSGDAPRAYRFAALFFAAFLLLMMIGNHEGFVEDLWLIGFAAVMVLLVVRDVIIRRRPR